MSRPHQSPHVIRMPWRFACLSCGCLIPFISVLRLQSPFECLERHEGEKKALGQIPQTCWKNMLMDLAQNTEVRFSQSIHTNSLTEDTTKSNMTNSNKVRLAKAPARDAISSAMLSGTVPPPSSPINGNRLNASNFPADGGQSVPAPSNEGKAILNLSESCGHLARKLHKIVPGESQQKQYCRAGLFPDGFPGIQKRLAVLMRGEAFRGMKGMFDRSIQVNSATLRCQKDACESHMEKIIKPFESCGFRVDVFFSAWRAHDRKGSNSSQQLIDFYEGRVAQARFANHKRYEAPGSAAREERLPQAVNFETGIAMIANHSVASRITYDAVLVLRFDLIVKENFLEPPVLYQPWERVMLPFREWLLRSNSGMVADTIHWFPWKYANCILKDGFREHYSAGIKDTIGVRNLGYLDTGYHDANSMADWNPLYKQCRPEQAYDVLGGFVVIVFSTAVVDGKKLLECGEGVGGAVIQQGVPRTIPASMLSFHLWSSGKKHSLWLRNALSAFRGFGQFPTTVLAQNVPQSNMSGSQPFTSSLAWRSMVLGYNGMKNSANIKYAASFKDFQLDRIILVRADYRITQGFIDAYKCSTNSSVCVGFGAQTFPEIPVLLITSQELADVIFNKSSLEHQEVLIANMSKGESILRWSVKVSCTKC